MNQKLKLILEEGDWRRVQIELEFKVEEQFVIGGQDLVQFNERLRIELGSVEN